MTATRYRKSGNTAYTSNVSYKTSFLSWINRPAARNAKNPVGLEHANWLAPMMHMGSGSTLFISGLAVCVFFGVGSYFSGMQCEMRGDRRYCIQR